jgi:hypothetical protein
MKTNTYKRRWRRWSTTLVAALFLFLLNWGVWAYSVIVKKDWGLTPVSEHLTYLQNNGSVGMARIISGFIAIFLIILSLRIYLYLLLLEYDDKTNKQLFFGHKKWLLRLEFWLRCAAVVAVNFIYYSSIREKGDFKYSVIVTTGLVFLWDLVMMSRLYKSDTLRGVFQRDFLLFGGSLVYFFLEPAKNQIPQAYTPLPFLVVSVIAVTIFWIELTSTYMGVIKRLFGTRSLIG